MTDRELLELAAKAHGGIPFRVIGADPGHYWCEQERRCSPQWNPLLDDGDALRLAVKLQLDIRPNGDQYVEIDLVNCDEPFGITLAKESGPDMYAATRRAIVRAAAALAPHDNDRREEAPKP